MVAPANDNIDNALPVVVVVGSYTSPHVAQTEATTEPATAAPNGWIYAADAVDPANAFRVEPGPPNHKTLWWRYEPATSGTATFDTAASPGDGSGANNNDTEMCVYRHRGGALARALEVAPPLAGTAGDVVGLRAKYVCAVTAGQVYYVQIGYYSAYTPLPGVILTVTGPNSVPPWVVSQTGATDTTVDIAWTGGGPTFTGYEVTVDAGPPHDAGTALTHAITGLSPITDYEVGVCGYIDTPTGHPALTIAAATASGAYGGEEADKAIDASTATQWTMPATVGWIRLQPTTLSTVYRYRWRPRTGYANAAPRSWTFEGSNDGSAWTVLDTRTGIANPAEGEVRAYNLSAPATFTYYRLNITANCGGQSWTSLATIALDGAPTTSTRARGPVVSITATTSAAPPAPDPGAPAPGVASQTVRVALGLPPAPTPDAPHFFTWQNPAGGGWAHDGPRSDGLIGYTITHGRREPLGRPAPAVVTVTLLVPIGAPSPEIGDRFRIALAAEAADVLGLAPGDRVRATAKITDTETDPTYLKILPGHGPAVRHTVTATAMIARQQVALFDGRAWPVESAGARAERVLDWLGLAGTIDAGGPDLAAPETVQNVGAAMTAVMDSTGSQFVDQRDGTVDFHDGREHRRGTPVVVSLTSAELLALNFTFRKSVGDVINRATITLADGATQVIVADAFSEDPFTGPGPYPTAIATLLVDEADAAALATLLVSRRARPSYQLPAVTVDLARSVDTATLSDVLAVRAADKIQISGMPAGSPWDALPNVYAEGYTETATAYAWRLSLVVSDPLQTGPALRWMDVPDGVAWSDVRDGFPWLAAARTDNPADLL